MFRQAVRLALVLCVVGTDFVAAPFGYGAVTLLHRFRAKDQHKRARMLQASIRRAFSLMHDTLRLVGLLDLDPRSLRNQLPQIFQRHWLRSLLADARFFAAARRPLDSGVVIEAGMRRFVKGFVS